MKSVGADLERDMGAAHRAIPMRRAIPIGVRIVLIRDDATLDGVNIGDELVELGGRQVRRRCTANSDACEYLFVTVCPIGIEERTGAREIICEDVTRAAIIHAVDHFDREMALYIRRRGDDPFVLSS